jgi:hypothetical protein
MSALRRSLPKWGHATAPTCQRIRLLVGTWRENPGRRTPSNWMVTIPMCKLVGCWARAVRHPQQKSRAFAHRTTVKWVAEVHFEACYPASHCSGHDPITGRSNGNRHRSTAIHIRARRRCGRMSAWGGRAAADPRAPHRPADEHAGRFTWTGLVRGICPGIAAIRLGSWPQCADRHPLGCGRYRTLSPIRGRIGRRPAHAPGRGGPFPGALRVEAAPAACASANSGRKGQPCRAQAPERRPCSMVRLPTVKPSSVLDPCGSRTTSMSMVTPGAGATPAFDLQPRRGVTELLLPG